MHVTVPKMISLTKSFKFRQISFNDGILEVKLNQNNMMLKCDQHLEWQTFKLLHNFNNSSYVSAPMCVDDTNECCEVWVEV